MKKLLQITLFMALLKFALEITAIICLLPVDPRSCLQKTALYLLII